MNLSRSLPCLGISVLFISLSARAALSVESAYLPDAALAFYADQAAINASPFFAEIKKMTEKVTKDKEDGEDSDATKRINDALVGFFGPNGAGATKVIEDDPFKQLDLESKDFISVVGSLAGLELIAEDKIPDAVMAVQFGKKIDPAKLLEVVKKQLAENYPAGVLKESRIGAHKVHTLAFGDKTEDDLHFFITGDQPKTLLILGTLGGISKALANEKGSVPEKFKAALVLHGKPQFWISLVVPEANRAQIAAATAQDPFGAGSSALGSAESLALSCNFGTELTSKLTVAFAKPEGAAFVMQLAAPANATPPDWTKNFTFSKQGNTAIVTNKTTVKEIEGLVETATKPTAPVPAGK